MNNERIQINDTDEFNEEELKNNESNVYKSTQRALEMLTSMGGRKNTLKMKRDDQLR